MSSLIARTPNADTLRLVEGLNGRWHGYSAICRCPAHNDSDPSLSIRQGDRGILVTCFAGCTAEDVLRALRHVTPGGLPSSPPVATGRMRSVTPLWDEAVGVTGTIAQRYLRSRFLTASLPDVRFHPRCPHKPKPHTEFKPALLVAIREGRTLLAVQRIFLDRDGQAIEKATLGTAGHGAWQGGRPVDGKLAIAEGFETAAAYTALTGTPCWASLGARRLPLIALSDDIVDLTVAEDHDDEGRRAGAITIELHRTNGILARPHRPRVQGFDWADVLSARERRRGEVA